MDELIELMGEDKGIFFAKAISYFNRALGDIDGFFLDNEELSDELLNNKLYILLCIREFVENSKMTARQKTQLFIRIDKIVNVLVKYDVNDSFMESNVHDKLMIRQLIKSCEHDYGSLHKVRKYIYQHRHGIDQKTIFLAYGGSNSSVISEISSKLNDHEKVDLKEISLLTGIIKLKEKTDYETYIVIEQLFKILENDSFIRYKFDNLDGYESVKKELIRKLKMLANNCTNKCLDQLKKAKIKQDIIDGVIYINPKFDFPSLNIDYRLEKRKLVRGKKIITIDDVDSPDLDGAFSITKDSDGVYDLEVYISDVPTFLSNNRKLAEEAYKRGVTYYIRNYKDKANINVDMLPRNLSHHLLSLRKGSAKNVICFNFKIDSKGNILSCDVGFKKIVVDRALPPYKAVAIASGKLSNTGIDTDIKLLDELKRIMLRNKGSIFLTDTDLVGINSILVNSYVGKEAALAFYRNNGIYTAEKQCGYTHSATPLRRIVSDINLSLFLNQKGLMKVADSDIHIIEDNMEEMLAHFNRVDRVQRYIDGNSITLRKILNI
ncbi:MAG: RNB domain-containing ribonuclease [Bacilli bacterium]|nr:RNB domain-containing ribonuclease [Bacilli bacterium]